MVMHSDFKSPIGGMNAQLVVNGLFYAVKDGLLMYDLPAMDSVFVNNSFCVMLGRECDIFHTGNNIGILPADLTRSLSDNYPKLFVSTLEQQADSQIVELKHPTGKQITVSLDRSILSHNGNHFLITVVRDITWLAMLERRKHEAERILHHDMRNYIANIGQIGQLIALKSDNKSIHELTDHLKRVSDALTNILIQDLDNYRLEQQTYSLNISDCNFNQLIGSIVASHSLKSSQSKVTMKYVHSGEVDGHEVYYQGDCLLLERMLDNLIKNAMEAAPEGSKVSIRTLETPESVTTEVHNAGAIPIEIRDAFLKSRVTTKSHGHGLGTYSARLIAKAHGGSIDFDTSEHGGTTLRVRLPRAEA